MMKRSLAAAALVLCLASACRGPVADEKIEALRSAVGSQPLDENAAERLAQEKTAIDDLAAELGRRAERRKSARLDWQVGELERLRHLFDEPEAWELSERHLSLALARDPAFAPAHVSLGQLYLTGGFEFAPRAEREFVRALEAGAGRPMPEARKGLFLAYYYQARWADALAEADRYLAIRGDDTDVRKMRAMSETNLKRHREASQ
jgi:hypothetical protein